MSFFFFSCYGDHRDLHSFPTRRSSDLNGCYERRASAIIFSRLYSRHRIHCTVGRLERLVRSSPPLTAARPGKRKRVRSEEHTSELQSLAYLVCRLLLEKKKTVSNDVIH